MIQEILVTVHTRFAVQGKQINEQAEARAGSLVMLGCLFISRID
jgi:hypothetical protein